MTNKPNWISETEIPTDIKAIGNADVKTEQDTLRRVLTLRISDNQSRLIQAKLTVENKGQKKKLKAADIVRTAIEEYCNIT